MMWPGSLACCFCARSPCCGSFHAGHASSQAVPLLGIEPRVVCSMGSDAAAGLAGILATKTPPAYAATHTLTMLTWNHFVPASDENLWQWAKEFERAHKCRVKIDFIPHCDTYVKV